MRADPNLLNYTAEPNANGPILFGNSHRPDFTTALKLFESQRWVIGIFGKQLIRQTGASFG
jgi:hypothetical protein